MDPASPQIKVFASLPLAVALDADLNVDASNWHWVHCLTFPVESLEEFSHKPYKWIRFAVGVVIGAEGMLSADSDSPNAVDYNANPPAEPANLFYHTSDEEKRRMFPIDPFGARSRVTSSANTPRRNDFRAQISSRDHETCLLTGNDGVYCNAAHLLSHSKGDEVHYISFQPVPAHHCNIYHSTFQPIHTAGVETLLEVTLSMILMTFEMAFCYSIPLTSFWVYSLLS
ncbi:hypothetical protein GALMADRAFT_246538 [Galerina marginata CBS 339.88]|uniref:HNH nuclease domain-containing protein n=1 Tax=Galerina marginata (strain CBS 339.88) TaxID=685588 RepID=A0A067TE25_GALM3|nr:hypothetical protein GALMADRAFT_246538 [Galerina marginata CBS 339.88]